MTFDTAQQRQPFRPHLFRSFFQGGFECSTHRERDGRRLDVTRSTAHDLKALEDYRMLAELGIRTIRDGLRWHLIDGGRAHPFDWTSFKPMLEAAEEAGVEVLWDLLHFGWPDHIDVFSADFPKRFAEFSAAAVELIKTETGRRPTVTPVNEISFLSWGGGDHALFNPMTKGRGDELKRQLVSASIAAIEAVWSVDREIRITHTDPAINVVPFPGKPRTNRLAQERSEAQFQAWDMISGRRNPELGGKPEYSISSASITIATTSGWSMVPRSSGRSPRRATLRRAISSRAFTSAMAGRCISRRPGSRPSFGRNGSTTSAPRCTRRWRPACRSTASASIP